MSRLRNSIIRKYRKAVDRARDALGSEITIYYKTGNRVSSSEPWDPVNLETVNPNVADNNNYLDEIDTKVIYATTSWTGLSDRYIPMNIPGGEIDRNDVIISCKLSDVLLDPSTTSGDTYFHNAVRIEIGGRFVKPKTTPLKYGLAGDLYSCALVASLIPD